MILAALALAAQLERVNQHVNGALHYGRDGVCSAFAFAKLAELRAAGYPANTLHLASVSVRGAPHMVLIADLAGREVVLDNRYAWTEDLAVLEARAGYVLVDKWPAATTLESQP